MDIYKNMVSICKKKYCENNNCLIKNSEFFCWGNILKNKESAYDFLLLLFREDKISINTMMLLHFDGIIEKFEEDYRRIAEKRIDKKKLVLKIVNYSKKISDEYNIDLSFISNYVNCWMHILELHDYSGYIFADLPELTVVVKEIEISDSFVSNIKILNLILFVDNRTKYSLDIFDYIRIGNKKLCRETPAQVIVEPMSFDEILIAGISYRNHADMDDLKTYLCTDFIKQFNNNSLQVGLSFQLGIEENIGRVISCSEITCGRNLSGVINTETTCTNEYSFLIPEDSQVMALGSCSIKVSPNNISVTFYEFTTMDLTKNSVSIALGNDERLFDFNNSCHCEFANNGMKNILSALIRYKEYPDIGNLFIYAEIEDVQVKRLQIDFKEVDLCFEDKKNKQICDENQIVKNITDNELIQATYLDNGKLTEDEKAVIELWLCRGYVICNNSKKGYYRKKEYYEMMNSYCNTELDATSVFELAVKANKDALKEMSLNEREVEILMEAWKRKYV